MRTALPEDGEPIQLEFAPHVVTLYWVQNVMIMAWRESVTAPVIEEVHRAAEPQRKRYPTGMSFVHMGRVQLTMLDSDTRQAFVRILQELSGYTAATAIVTPATGFWASALRSIATGIVVLSRAQVDLRIHERPEEVVEWLPAKHEEKTGIKVDLERLRRVLLRAADDIALRG